MMAPPGRTKPRAHYRWRRRFPLLTGAVALVLLGASRLTAQEDFRHTDPDRPIRVEDAYPVKYLEWEWQLGTRSEFAEGGDHQVSGLLELKTGFARNWQLGIEAHPAWTREAGTSGAAIEEFGVNLLFNLNQEGPALPAFAFRADLFTPGAGDFERQDFGGRATGIVTRSVRRLRLHANAGYTWASTADGGDFWSGGLAFDYPIGLFSKAILGDVYLEVPVNGGEARVWAELGSRIQLTNSTVLDLGLTSRMDQWTDGVANVGIVLGISRVFGVVGLVKVPPYPQPKLD